MERSWTKWAMLALFQGESVRGNRTIKGTVREDERSPRSWARGAAGEVSRNREGAWRSTSSTQRIFHPSQVSSTVDSRSIKDAHTSKCCVFIYTSKLSTGHTVPRDDISSVNTFKIMLVCRLSLEIIWYRRTQVRNISRMFWCGEGIKVTGRSCLKKEFYNSERLIYESLLQLPIQAKWCIISHISCAHSRWILGGGAGIRNSMLDACGNIFGTDLIALTFQHWLEEYNTYISHAKQPTVI